MSRWENSGMSDLSGKPRYSFMEAVRICVIQNKKIKRLSESLYLEYRQDTLVCYPYQKRDEATVLFGYPRFSQSDILNQDWVVLDDDDERTQR